MERQISTEILRIILMIFIIMHHLILNSYGLRGITTNNFDQLNTLWGGVNAFLVVAVNIFFIISGYYSIKFNLKKIINIALMVYFYSTVINVCFLIVGKVKVDFELFKSLIFPISSYWFILVYIILSIFSLYINIMLNNCSKVVLKYGLMSGGVIFCIYGFIIDNVTLGVNNGYSLIFAIFLYILGYYLKHHFEWSKNKIVFLLIYLGTCTLNGFLAMLFINSGKGSIAWTLYNYNNPLVVIGSVSLFLYFKGLRIICNKTSSSIFFASNSVLAVYIIHSTSILATYLNLFLKNHMSKSNFFFDSIFLLVYSVIIFCACALFEQVIRNGLFNNIFDRLSGYISKQFSK